MSDTVSAPADTAAAAGEPNSNEHHEEVAAPVTPAKKRGLAAPKLDSEGNPITKTPRTPATPKTKLDADGNPTPKTTRKAGASKQPKLDAEGSPIVLTPKKSARKAEVKAKTVKTEICQDEGNGSGGDNAIAANAGAGDEANPPATPAFKKRASNAGAASETPSKRIKGNALPTCKAELSEQDKMMMEWKDQGKSWGDINAEYARITGKPVGRSTLTVRYGRLKASFVELKDGDMELVLYAKDVIAQEQVVELEVFKKRQETESWGRIAIKIAGLGADTYTGDAISKAYAKEKHAGFPHKQTGRYTAIMLNGPEGSHDSQDDDSQEDAAADKVEVDFDEEGDAVHIENTEEPTPGTVIHKKELHTDAPVKGVNGIRQASLAESTFGKSSAQEDDGAVFN